MPEIPLGQPIPDDPSDPKPDPDIESLSDAEINKAIAAGGKIAAKPNGAAAAAEATPAEEAAAEEVDEADSDPAETEGDKADDASKPPEAPSLQKLVAESAALELEKVKAELAIQKAHGSRLAGELGHLKKPPKASAEPEGSDHEDDGEAGKIHRRIDTLERKTQKDAVARAVNTAIVAEQPELDGLTQEDVNDAAKGYVADLKAAYECEDASVATEIAKAIVQNIRVDARKLANDRARAEVKARSADPAAELKGRKLASAIIQSSGRTATRPQPKTPDEMSLDELNRTLAASRRRAGMEV